MDPMLLALDTTLPLLALSTKSPARETPQLLCGSCRGEAQCQAPATGSRLQPQDTGPSSAIPCHTALPPVSALPRRTSGSQRDTAGWGRVARCPQFHHFTTRGAQGIRGHPRSLPARGSSLASLQPGSRLGDGGLCSGVAVKAKGSTHRSPRSRCRRTPPAHRAARSVNRGGRRPTPAGPASPPAPPPRRSPTWSSLQPRGPDTRGDLGDRRAAPRLPDPLRARTRPALPSPACAPTGLALTQGSSGEAPGSVILDPPNRKPASGRAPAARSRAACRREPLRQSAPGCGGRDLPAAHARLGGCDREPEPAEPGARCSPGVGAGVSAAPCPPRARHRDDGDLSI